MEIARRKSHFIQDFSFPESCIIDKNFRKVILEHVIGNYSSSIQSPLFLAIYGNPGEGKTFQTLQICHEHRLNVCYYSGAELSGNYERDSILEFSDDYTRACNYCDNGEYCVIIIDDFHLSPASTKAGVSTTVNSQLLTGYLMNLCDKAKSAQINSVPIILLGNTFEDVYEPLKRDGRMNFFQWIAPLSMKKQIVKDLFKNYLSFKDVWTISNFVEKYRDMPISFFAEIKNDIDKRSIGFLMDKLGHSDIGTYINNFQVLEKRISFLELSQLAEHRKKEFSSGN